MARRSSSSRKLAVHERQPRVLLVEDDADLRMLLAEVLERDGCEVIQAPDGTEALAVLAEPHPAEAETRPIDLIISDVHLPGCTGLQILQGVREQDRTTPIILITGFGNQEVRQRARQFGVTAFFDKPFEADDLRTAVLNILQPGARQVPCACLGL